MSYHSSLDAHLADQDEQYEAYLRDWEYANRYLLETDEGKFVTAMFNIVLLIQNKAQTKFYHNESELIFNLATYAESFKKEGN